MRENDSVIIEFLDLAIKAFKEQREPDRICCGNCKYFWDGLCTKHREDDLAQRKPDDFCSFDFEQKE